MAYSNPSRTTPGGTPELAEDDPLLELSRIVDLDGDVQVGPAGPAAEFAVEPPRGDDAARTALQKLAAAQRALSATRGEPKPEPATAARTVLPAAAPRLAPAGNGVAVAYGPKPQNAPYPPLPPMSRTNLRPAPGSAAERQATSPRQPASAPASPTVRHADTMKPAAGPATAPSPAVRPAPPSVVAPLRSPQPSHSPQPVAAPLAAAAPNVPPSFLPPVPDYSPEALRAKLAAAGMKPASPAAATSPEPQASDSGIAATLVNSAARAVSPPPTPVRPVQASRAEAATARMPHRPVTPIPVFDFEAELEQVARDFEPVAPAASAATDDFESELLAEMEAFDPPASARLSGLTAKAPVFDDLSIVSIPEDTDVDTVGAPSPDHSAVVAELDLEAAIEDEFAAFENEWDGGSLSAQEVEAGSAPVVAEPEPGSWDETNALEAELVRELDLANDGAPVAAEAAFAGRQTVDVAPDDVELSLEDEMIEAIRGRDSGPSLIARSPFPGVAAVESHANAAHSYGQDDAGTAVDRVSVPEAVSLASAEEEVDDPWAEDIGHVEDLDDPRPALSTAQSYGDETIDWETELATASAPSAGSEDADEAAPFIALRSAAADGEDGAGATGRALAALDRKSLADDLQAILDEMSTRFAKPAAAATASAVPMPVRSFEQGVHDLPVDVTEAATELDEEPEVTAIADADLEFDPILEMEIDDSVPTVDASDHARSAPLHDLPAAPAVFAKQAVDIDDAGFLTKLNTGAETRHGPVDTASLTDDEALVAELAGGAPEDMDIVDWLDAPEQADDTPEPDTAAPATPADRSASALSLEDELEAVLGEGERNTGRRLANAETAAFGDDLDRAFAAVSSAAARPEPPRIQFPRATPRPAPAAPAPSLEDELELAFQGFDTQASASQTRPQPGVATMPVMASMRAQEPDGFGDTRTTRTIVPGQPVARPVPSPVQPSPVAAPVQAEPVRAAAVTDDDLLDALEMEFASAVAELEAPVLETTPVDTEAVHYTDEFDLPEIDTDARLPSQGADEFEHEFADTFREFEETRAAPVPAGTSRGGTASESHGSGAAALPRDVENPFERDWADERQQWTAQGTAAGAGTLASADDDDLPELAFSDQPAAKPRNRGLMIASVAGGVALLGAVAAFAYSWNNGTDTVSAPTIIRADSGPIKVQPEEPGGRAVPNQDKVVYTQVRGTDTSAPSQEQLVDTVEEPALVDRRAAVPAADAALDDAMVKDDARAGEPDPDAEATLIEPRRVRTMVVRPDGTIVEREAEETAVAAAAPLPATSATTDAQAVQETEADVLQDNVAALETQAVDAGAADIAQALPGAADGEAISGADAVAEAADISPSGDVTLPDSANTGGEPKSEERLEVAVTEAGVTDAVALPEPAPAIAEAGAPDAVADIPEPQAVAEPAAPAPTPAPARPAARAAQPEQQAAATARPVAPVTTGGSGGYVVQIASHPTAALAQDAAADLSRKFGGVIGGRGVSIQKANIDGKGTFYRVRIAAGGKAEATQLCTQIKASGGSCFVAR